MTFLSPFRAPVQSPFPKDAAAISATLFYDTFTGTDGTLLTAHTPDIDTVGGGWNGYINPSSVTIQSEEARGAIGGSVVNSILAANVNSANVTITHTIRFSTFSANDTIGGTIVRLVDSSNYWAVLIYRGAGGLPTRGLYIAETTGGTFIARAVVAIPGLAGNTNYTITTTTNGDTITAAIGSSSVTYISANHNTATRHGIRLQSQSTDTVYIDDYRITTP